MWFGVRRLCVFVAVLAAVAAAVAILENFPDHASFGRVALVTMLGAIAAGAAAAGLILFVAWVVEGFLIGLKKIPPARTTDHNELALNDLKLTGEQPACAQPRRAKRLSTWRRVLYTMGAFFGALLLSFLVGTILFAAGGVGLAETMFGVAWLVAIGATVYQWKSTASNKEAEEKSPESKCEDN